MWYFYIVSLGKFAKLFIFLRHVFMQSWTLDGHNRRVSYIVFGTLVFTLGPGRYAIAVRHSVNLIDGNR